MIFIEHVSVRDGFAVTAYNKNNNEEFTLYIGRNELFSFKFVYEPTDNIVYLIDIYSENDCYTIGPVLSDIYT